MNQNAVVSYMCVQDGCGYTFTHNTEQDGLVHVSPTLAFTEELFYGCGSVRAPVPRAGSGSHFGPVHNPLGRANVAVNRYKDLFVVDGLPLFKQFELLKMKYARSLATMCSLPTLHLGTRSPNVAR